MKKFLTLLLISTFITGCSTLDKVFPDTREEYKKSEALPDLEVPPDLTAGAAEQQMTIPSERGGSSAAQNLPTNQVVDLAIPEKQAELQDISSDKKLLSIPDEFTVVWNDLENLLIAVGIKVDGKDQSKGIYSVSYVEDTGSEEKGWMSKLTFWESSKESYQISLTGVGNKTEVVVLNADGEWESNINADRILSKIRTQYNANQVQ